MKITYQSSGYKPELVTARYVRHENEEEYLWCERGPNRSYDIRQGTVTGNELPINIRAEADASKGKAFSFVDWPLA